MQTGGITLGFTPARGGSKGVPRKNIKLLCGKPLIQWTADVAMSCPEIDRYIINTEDPEIEMVAKSIGVETQGRPEEFWHDNTKQEVDRLMMYAISELEKRGMHIDIVVLLYATAPLRVVDDISRCVQLIRDGGYDSALTLYEDRKYIWKRIDGSASVEPVNYDPKTRGPNQLEGWNQWVENKAVYAFRKNLLMETGCRIGGKVAFAEMSKLCSIDIDTPDDFALAESLLHRRVR